MSSSDESPQTRRGRRRWYQFGLSTLLAAIAIVAIFVTWQKPRLERWLEALTAKPAPAGSMVILHIDSDGKFIVRSEHRGMDELKRFLETEMELAQYLKEPKTTLLIMTEAAAPMKSVLEVIEIAHQVGFPEIELTPYRE